ncbi:MAG: long-chain-fatty-acid--CoA ligase [Pseudomonadota bacterium]|jgi:long-chain acyl-CoA synthetase|nr:long-chain-fatty-acid--CoA ligase [Rubrivivax sp.]MCA3258108.1 long-chain-fatty-acid--CoA ligase [Rubrivivax sp.]MCE2912266.1 long-chain-fatty-acid--CoA ligase [Rubrivivax sp.]MCZ8031425.1 long-chain-fatty-acid--CoA ligase [Rubrivivax sp.]
MSANPTPWLAHYPPGVPPGARIDAYRSLPELLEHAFRRYADRDALCCMESRLTYRDLEQMSEALGAWLQSRGLERGSRVALMMPNVPQYLVALAAVLRAGYVVVNVNPLYTARELEHQLRDSGAEAIVVLENFAATLEECIDRVPVKHVVLATIGDLLGWWKGRFVTFAARHLGRMVPEFRLPLDGERSVTHFADALEAGSRMTMKRADVGPDDVAFLQYTGGTTGVSKGATLLHRNVVANIMQSEAWFAPTLQQLGSAQMTVVCALPLYHIFALTVCALLGAHFGTMNLLIPNPRDIPGFVKTLSRHRVNMFPAVNTLFNALANDANFARLDFSGLRISNGGGMAVQQATAEKWLKITGCPIVEGYGLSETSPVATVNRLDLTEFSGTIGLPLPDTEIAIRDDAGNNVPFGTPGEICIRGPQVMAGYWNRPDETANVMTADGFFKSGDIGVMDERGYVRIVDRKKDMILVSGFNVYPNEIEQVVSLHPGVLECAAIGIPDEKSGEAVKLFVVKTDPTLSEDDLAGYCRENFTAYKRPKYIEFRDELPKSNVGKILRRELRSS